MAGQRLGPGPGQAPLDELFAGWLEAYATQVRPPTARTVELYVRVLFLPRFSTLAELDAVGIAESARARLGEVSRKTVTKELSALRVFLAW